MIVRCRDTHDRVVWINVVHVQTMTELPNGTEITFASGDIQHVRESAETLAAQLEASPAST